jgi:hypothetical protein
MIYCLVCREDVSRDGYNLNYYGVAIHHNFQDSYCGPVIKCDTAPNKKTVARLMRNFRARERYDYRKRQAQAMKELYDETLQAARAQLEAIHV